MLVLDVMTPEVTTCTPDTGFKDLVRLLLDQYVSGVPVLDGDGRLVGIVTEADLLAHEAYRDSSRRLLSVLADRLLGRDPDWVDKASALRAADLMTPDPVTVRPQDDVGLAARLLLEHDVGRLPVVDGERLVGVVSRSDLLRWFARPDDAVLQSVQGALAATAVAGAVEASVEDGVVTLTGRVASEDDRAAVADLVRAIAGVVAVDDRLASPDSEAVLGELHPPLG
jgi:CBS domain-containing protein